MAVAIGNGDPFRVELKCCCRCWIAVLSDCLQGDGKNVIEQAALVELDVAIDVEGATIGVFKALHRPVQGNSELPLKKVLAKRRARCVRVADESPAFEVLNNQIYDVSNVLELTMPSRDDESLKFRFQFVKCPANVESTCLS